MTEEQIRKVAREISMEVTSKSVQEYQKQLSNFMGDVKDQNKAIIDEMQDIKAFMKDLMPARDGLITIQNLIRFFKWAPSVGVVVYWIWKRFF